VPEIRLEYTPQPRQVLLHTATARQIFYGGAAGGGKSHSIRWDAYHFCLANPGLQAYLFRRTRPELEDNHIKFCKRELPPEVGSYNETRKIYEFRNGSALVFCYCEQESDVYRYLGTEMHWIGLDEASRMLESQIQLLRTRNRLGGFRPNPDYALALPRFVLASNPGGPAHSFLKQTFIDPAPPETVFFDSALKNPLDPNDKGWTTLYIPAKMRDNAYIDAGYEASFSGLAPELARAYREGDWDAVVGAAIHNLSKDRHMLRPFSPPKHWTRFMVMDWGVARPFSIGWYAVSEGAVLGAQGYWPERYLPAGALVRYAEWYGWNGRPNQGLRLDSQAVARGIKERERERAEVMDYRVADSECWSKHDGPSVIERMVEADPTLATFRPSVKDRKHNYWELISRLAGSSTYRDDGKEEIHPMLFCTENCRPGFWRTLPGLLLDESEPDKGWATKDSEDHCADEVAYACRSRPFIYTKAQRREEEEREHFRKYAASGGADPYSTR
jgi:hypothetical protein